MAVTTPPPRKYNPGFLTDDELIASFSVRTREFESIVEMLRECTGSSNQHQIVIGPRGSGKTSLLLRVAAEARRDAALSAAFFPVVFAEESYEVATAGEFWLECLARLADQAPLREDGPDLHLTFEDLRAIRDDGTLAERCLAALLDFSDREDRRLVLMVENLNMMFRDMADSREAGWRLRKTLQTEPRIILLASATSRFDAIDHPEQALYDLFRTLTLRPLGTKECAELWEAVSGQCAPQDTIRSLEILTGGSPRLLAILARFGGGLSFRELMADLLNLIDDHTEYFKSHLESLPAQERRVYLALADLWKPAFTKEVADRARLDTSKCSAQLTRLIERGAVQVAGGTIRRKHYYLSERLYNIYYLLRRSRRPDRLIEALIRFMASYYSPPELKDIGARMVREVENLEPEMRSLHFGAFARLVDLPELAGEREELLAMAPADFIEALSQISASSDEVRTVPIDMKPDHPPAGQPAEEMAALTEFRAAAVQIAEALESEDQYRADETLTIFDKIVHRFGASDNPTLLQLAATALFHKGTILGTLERLEEALATYDEVVRRFGSSETPDLLEQVAKTLVNKGVTLGRLNRPEEELATYDEVEGRFGSSETPGLLEPVAKALFYKGITLGTQNRPEEALAAYDEVVRCFGSSEAPDLLEQVAKALFNKGVTLHTLERSEEALATYDEVVRRFGSSETLDLLEQVAKALVNKGVMLRTLERSEEALAACDEVVRCFGSSETPDLLEQVAKALVNTGVTLGRLNRPEEELAIYEEVERRFGSSEAPGLLEPVARALVYKGVTLGTLNRSMEALAAYDEIVRRFEANESSDCRSWVEFALLYKASIELMLQRYESVIETAGRVLDPRQTESQERRLQGHVLRARAILASGEPSASEQDIETILSILPEIDSLPKESLDALVFFSATLGPVRMRELIQASPAADLLLPLTTALEWELGLEPRVAREVEEVARDIRRDLAEAREAVAGASSGAAAAEPKRRDG